MRKRQREDNQNASDASVGTDQAFYVVFSTERKLPTIWEVIQPTVDSCLNVKRRTRLQDLTRAHTSSPSFIALPKIADSFQTVSAIVKNIAFPR